MTKGDWVMEYYVMPDHYTNKCFIYKKENNIFYVHFTDAVTLAKIQDPSLYTRLTIYNIADYYRSFKKEFSSKYLKEFIEYEASRCT